MKFAISVRSLNRRWAWTSVCAIGAFAVLAILDTKLKSATGYGTADLQRATTANDVNLILVAWSTSRPAVLAGFNLGFDYLFMPLWGFALFYGALAARERFAPNPGKRRRVLGFFCAIPLAGMLLDAAENAIELGWILRGATGTDVLIGSTVTDAKWLCVIVGLVLSIAALAGRVVSRTAKA
ncbi:MAG TPA: hypothetical protein VG891_07415 [Rhizomicrobium sp.]|nr:hypothetical protein [Rhizomicrobium sp.]